MRISTVRGILSPERELFKEENGEKFYKTTLRIDEQNIPVVASMFVLKDKSGKCEVTCTVRQQPGEGYRFVYLYAANVTKCSEDLPDLNVVNIGGQIARVYPTRFVGSAGNEMNIYKLAWFAENRINFINVRAMGAQARKLSDAKKGQILNCKCYMQMYNNKIDFYILESKRRDQIKKGVIKNGNS